MIWTKRLSWLMVAWVSAQAVAQMVVPGNEEDYSVERRDGIEFGMNIGVYRGFSQAAYFFDGMGSSLAEGNSANRMWDVVGRMNDLPASHPVRRIAANRFNGTLAPDEDSGPLMQYRPAIMFGLKAVKFWNPETALVLQMDVVSLTAEGVWPFQTGNLETGMGGYLLEYVPIVGKEDRLHVSLGYRTSVYMMQGMSCSFEIGPMFNAVSIDPRGHDLIFTDETGNLVELNLITGSGAAVGGVYNNASNILTQLGTGFYSQAGLDLEFDKGGHVELNLRASRDNLNLGIDEYTGWNLALFITWMIPSQIGDFVRASF